jgi:hypothetical protein
MWHRQSNGKVILLLAVPLLGYLAIKFGNNIGDIVSKSQNADFSKINAMQSEIDAQNRWHDDRNKRLADDRKAADDRAFAKFQQAIGPASKAYEQDMEKLRLMDRHAVDAQNVRLDEIKNEWKKVGDEIDKRSAGH